MINLLLGQPGGGKSYESVAFHVIPAVVEQGRKVITNLPLLLDMWEHFFPGSSKLIEIRGTYRHENRICQPFSRLEDYGDAWRKEGSELGPLYIVDECHKSLPKIGTPLDVEEWYAEHRHEGADVLLITQSYGKINTAIRDAVQVVYRCKKATAFGSNDKYIRKVQDGLRGDVVNTQIRGYESKYFPLYKSHTKTSGSVQEAYASDIVPIWKHWTVRGTMLMGVLFVGALIYALNQESSSERAARLASEAEQFFPTSPAALGPVAIPVEAPAPTAEPRGPDKKLHPYEGFTLHLAALMHGHRDADGPDSVYINGYVTVAQNGQPVSRVSLSELRDAGYEVVMHSIRVISLMFKGVDVGYVVDDLPTVALKPSGPAVTSAN